MSQKEILEKVYGDVNGQKAIYILTRKALLKKKKTLTALQQAMFFHNTIQELQTNEKEAIKH